MNVSPANDELSDKFSNGYLIIGYMMVSSVGVGFSRMALGLSCRFFMQLGAQVSRRLCWVGFG